MKADEPSWAVAVIEPGRDEVAYRKLRSSGYRTLLLTRRRLYTGHNRKGWRRSGDFVSEPIFPGYLFVQLSPGEALPDHDLIPEYHGLIRDGRTTLPNEVVISWWLRINAGEFDDKRQQPRQVNGAKFQPANSPEQLAAILQARFAEMIGSQYAAVG